MPRINKQKTALKQLNLKGIHFTRKNDDTWVYYTSGYLTSYHHDINKYLNSMGFVVLTADFDNICCKTRSEFKKK